MRNIYFNIIKKNYLFALFNCLFKKGVKSFGLFVLTFLLANNILYAQDIQFSQFYSAPTYLNPAFAGSAHHYRGTLHQRIQWPSLTANYVTSLFSFDKYFNKYKSGLGFMVIRDMQGTNAISSTQVGLQYAYELHVSDRITVRAGLQLDYMNRSLDWVNLRFPSQFSDVDGFTGGSLPFQLSPRTHMIDVSSGVVVYTPTWWFAFSGHHINTPRQSFMGEASSLPFKGTMIAGYKIPINKATHENVLKASKEISITPTLHYKFQGKSDQVDFGMYGIYDQFLLAYWYRGIPFKKYKVDLHNNESMVAVVGWMYKSISVTYSYDFTISKLTKARSGGAHELNITFIHHKSHKHNKPMRRLPCPHFYKTPQHH